MANNGSVTTDLCEARMNAVDVRLTAIEKNGQEAREGVGKILRVLLEGNGQPSFTSRLQAVEGSLCTVEQCLQDQKEAARDTIKESIARERQRKQTKFALCLALGGWIVTIVGIFAKFIKL